MSTRNSTVLAHKLPAHISSRLKQDDVSAIEHVFSDFKTWQNVHGSLDIYTMLTDTDTVQDIMKQDPSAFAFVAAKYGYSPTGEKLPGVVADPAWLAAIQTGPMTQDQG